MRKHLSKVVKWQFLWIAVLMAGNASSQNLESEVAFDDSLDRFGAIGMRPGIFFNLNEKNSFTMSSLGVFLDYSFGKFNHSIELDFLVRKPKKFFKNAYSPCFNYHFSMKTLTWNNFNLHSGLFVNCRKDVLSRKQYYQPNDTVFSYSKEGFHTIFSFGPSLEISRKVFFPGKKSFLSLGARFAYSFDILGYGTTANSSQAKSTGLWEKIRAQDRFQRDAFALTLKIGWGKLIARIEKPDYGLQIE